MLSAACVYAESMFKCQVIEIYDYSEETAFRARWLLIPHTAGR